MRLPSLLQFRILKEAFKALFTGPYTTKFPYKPHTPAEKFRGKPEFDEEECVGCGACVEVCPSDALELFDDLKKQKRRIVLLYDKCIFCGECQANCITEKGIRLTPEYDLATFDRAKAKTSIEKDLLLCEYCGAIIGTTDHVKWVVRRLGLLAYANLGLLLVSHEELGLAEREVRRLKELPKRSDRIKFLCPKCRREVVLAD